MRAKRVTLYRDRKGEWRYRVQAFNNRTIASSEEGFARKAYALRRIERDYPGVELVDQT